jgi:hypothetical protein
MDRPQMEIFILWISARSDGGRAIVTTASPRR